jgi:uncharacterized membrane protein
LTTTRRPVTGRTRDLVVSIDKVIFRLATHWLLLANLFWGLYVGLPFLAPLFMHAGYTTPANIIYTLYRPLCHQRPDRSYFIDGPQVVYSPQQLEAAGVRAGPFSRDIGNQTLGWKVAFCERDVAIYSSIFLTGLVYGLIRRRLGKWLMPFRVYIIFLIPMGLDGTLQLFGLYESTWYLRTITGLIFGVGSVIFAYPYLEDGFADVRRTLIDKLHLDKPAQPAGS